MSEFLASLPPVLVCLLACGNRVFVVASEVSKYAGGYGMVK